MGRFSSFLGQSLSYKGSKAATDAVWATGNGTTAYPLPGITPPAKERVANAEEILGCK